MLIEIFEKNRKSKAKQNQRNKRQYSRIMGELQRCHICEMGTPGEEKEKREIYRNKYSML